MLKLVINRHSQKLTGAQMAYKQLTLEKRYELKAYMQAGFSRSWVATKLGVHKSTVTRELQRNSSRTGYFAKVAHQRAVSRRRGARKHKQFTDEIRLQVNALLSRDFSPEQIAGRLKKESNLSVSHERIYQHIREDRSMGGTFWKHLRHSNRIRRKRNAEDGRGQIPDRIFIDDRPKIVDQRRRIGDWEADTMWKPREKGALLSLVERKTGYTLISWLPDRKAERVADKIVSLLSDFKEQVHTLTVDNGSEFKSHKRIAKALKAKVYFSHPYHAWERGTVENTNGLIRQYFPKKSSLDRSIAEHVPFVQQRLNMRPRKRLKFKTPFEKMFKLSVALIC